MPAAPAGFLGTRVRIHRGSWCARLTLPWSLQNPALRMWCRERSAYGVAQLMDVLPSPHSRGTEMVPQVSGCPHCWATPSPFPPCVVSVVYYCWLKGTGLNICQTPVLSPECVSKQTGRKQHHPCWAARVQSLGAGRMGRRSSDMISFRAGWESSRRGLWVLHPAILPWLPLEGQYCRRDWLLATDADGRCWRLAGAWKKKKVTLTPYMGGDQKQGRKVLIKSTLLRRRHWDIWHYLTGKSERQDVPACGGSVSPNLTCGLLEDVSFLIFIPCNTAGWRESLQGGWGLRSSGGRPIGICMTWTISLFLSNSFIGYYIFLFSCLSPCLAQGGASKEWISKMVVHSVKWPLTMLLNTST